MVKKRSHQAVSKGEEPEYSKRFIIQVTLELLDKEVLIRLLVDSGASGPILHEDSVRKNGLLVKKRKLAKQVKNANEEPIPNAGTHYTKPTVLVIGQHAEDMVWEVGMIESQIDGYLPVSWLQKQNPSINWETGTLKWRSAHCRIKCIRRHILAALITEVQMEEELEQEILMAAVIWPYELQEEPEESGIPEVYQQ